MCVSLKAEFHVRKSSPDAEAWHLAARISIVFVCIRKAQKSHLFARQVMIFPLAAIAVIAEICWCLSVFISKQVIL